MWWWWSGLHVPVRLGAVLLGAITPGRVFHDKLVSGEGPDEEKFTESYMNQTKRSSSTLPGIGKLGPLPGARL